MKYSVITLISFILFSIINFFIIEGDYYENYTIVFACFVVIAPSIIYLFLDNLKKIDKKRKLDLLRVKYRFISFIIFLLFFFLYSLVMQELGVIEYSIFLSDFILVIPVVVIFLPIYLIWADVRQEFVEDDSYIFSYNLFVNKKIIWIESRKFILSSLVKVVFIPLMCSFLTSAMSLYLNQKVSWNNAISVSVFLFNFGLCIDLLIATSGYIFCSPFLSTEVRSIDTTLTGWFFCLICYPPLASLQHKLTSQADSLIWTNWLTPDSIFYWIWGGLICITWIMYWWSTLSFGFRFSNLSWRGLVNTGMYKFFKHPAYLSKNIYWWLYTIPFFGVQGWDLFQNFLGLILINIIYFARAKTEERHLMNFIEYRNYSLWIDQNGFWSKIKKW